MQSHSQGEWAVKKTKIFVSLGCRPGRKIGWYYNNNNQTKLQSLPCKAWHTQQVLKMRCLFLYLDDCDDQNRPVEELTYIN